VKSGNSIDAFTTEGVNRFFVTLLARLIVIVPLYIAWCRLHPREEVVNPGVLLTVKRTAETVVAIPKTVGITIRSGARSCSIYRQSWL
jgi:hypothetical protein